MSVAILEELRTDPIRRSGVLVGGSVVGLALAQVIVADRRQGDDDLQGPKPIMDASSATGRLLR